METVSNRLTRWMLILGAIAGLAFAAGLAFGISRSARADDTPKENTKVIYPKRTELDFEGLAIEGEIKNPGEFYFQHRSEEKFDSLVQRRKNFNREILRDSVSSK